MLPRTSRACQVHERCAAELHAQGDLQLSKVGVGAVMGPIRLVPALAPESAERELPLNRSTAIPVPSMSPRSRSLDIFLMLTLVPVPFNWPALDRVLTPSVPLCLHSICDSGLAAARMSTCTNMCTSYTAVVLLCAAMPAASGLPIGLARVGCCPLWTQETPPHTCRALLQPSAIRIDVLYKQRPAVYPALC